MIAPVFGPARVNSIVIGEECATLVLNGAVGSIMAGAQTARDGVEGCGIVALDGSFSFSSDCGRPSSEVGGDGSGDRAAMGTKAGQSESLALPKGREHSGMRSTQRQRAGSTVGWGLRSAGAQRGGVCTALNFAPVGTGRRR